MQCSSYLFLDARLDGRRGENELKKPEVKISFFQAIVRTLKQTC